MIKYVGTTGCVGGYMGVSGCGSSIKLPGQSLGLQLPMLVSVAVPYTTVFLWFQ